MRLARSVPPVFVYGVALALFFIRPHTGWMIPDEFAHRFVFFVSGVYLAQHVFTLATWADNHMRPALALSLTYFACIAFFVWNGMIENRLVEVVASYTGAAATIMVISLLSARGFTKPLAYVGSRSLVIYLAFFIPMALSRVILIKLGFENADLVTALVYVTAVAGSLIAYTIALKTPLRFFYVRPSFLHLKKEASLTGAALSHA
jgi:peptidoglycan/LPS O-acetylase OafA/YrhL